MFSLVVGSQAKNFLKKCHPVVRHRILKKFDVLATTPFPQDVKRIHGRNAKAFRVRVGMYRIQYEVIQKDILVFSIERREQAY